MTKSFKGLSRREAIKRGVFAGVGAAAGRLSLIEARVPQQLEVITRPIPSTGERLPVVGLGTIGFGENEEQDIAPLREVLRRLPQLGGRVVDTAQNYRRSELVLGEYFEETGERDLVFLATKVQARGDDLQSSIALFEESFRRLRTDRIDLMQVHNVVGAEGMLPVLRAWKQEGRIRYVGITTHREQQHEQLTAIIRRETLDFIQVNYSIADRTSAEQILPLAADRGIAVLINVPFGKASLFPKVAGRPLPDWATDIDCASWGQFFLKYVVSHPAVTCTIPGTTKVAHLEDNLRGARGRLPDATMRRRMEQFWDGLS